MPWLLLVNNWKLIAIGVAILGTFFAGWHTHSWYDSYKTEKEETKIIKKLGEGETKIIDFNQKFSKEKANVKDNCIDQHIPTSISELLK